MTDYKSIINQARLITIKLVNSNFDLSSDFSGEQPMTLEIGTKWLNTSLDADTQSVMGVCEWHFIANGGEGSEPLVKVVGRYFVQYSAVGSEQEIAFAFLQDVGRMASYPYFRAHVTLLAGAAAVMLPPLPSINIGTFRKQSVIHARLRPRLQDDEESVPLLDEPVRDSSESAQSATAT